MERWNKAAGWAGKRQGSLQKEEVVTSHGPGLSIELQICVLLGLLRLSERKDQLFTHRH